jgi:dihydrofolate reductase
VAHRLYLTHIELNVDDADTWFPDFGIYQWRQVVEERHSADEKNPYNYRFETLERI